MRIHALRWAAPAVVMAALTLSAVGALAAPTGDEFAIRVPPATQPAAYVRVQGKELRIAATPEALDAAQPVKSLHVQTYRGGENEMMQNYTFPEVDVPLSDAGVAAKATLTYERVARSSAAGVKVDDRGGLFGQFSLSRKDSAGATWTYITGAGVGPQRNAKADRPVLDLPDLSKLVLGVQAKMDGNNAGIGVQLTAAGGASVQNVQKDGKDVPVRIEVTDKSGASVHSQRGNLEKFALG